MEVEKETSRKSEDVVRMVEREGVATADVTADVSIVKDTDIDSEIDTLGIDTDIDSEIETLGVGTDIDSEIDILGVGTDIDSEIDTLGIGTDIDSEIETLGVGTRSVVVVGIKSKKELEEMVALDCVGVGTRMAMEEEASNVNVGKKSVLTVTEGLGKEVMTKEDVVRLSPITELEVRAGEKDVSVAEMVKEVGPRESALELVSEKLEMNSASEEGRAKKSEIDTAISVVVGLGVIV